MELPIIISIIGMVFTGISVSAMIYFNSKNSKHTDEKEIRERIEEQTRVNLKLDEINRNTTDIKYDVSAVKKDVQKHAEKIVEIEASAKQAHHRLDSIERRLNKEDDE
jgi:hypothetical protein